MDPRRPSAKIAPNSCLLYVHMSIPTYIAYHWLGSPLDPKAELFLEHLLSYAMLKYPFKAAGNKTPLPTDDGRSADSVARVILSVFNKRHDTGAVADFILMRRMAHKCMFTGSPKDVHVFALLNEAFMRLFPARSLKVVNDIQAKFSTKRHSRVHISWEMFLSACVIDLLLAHGVDHYAITQLIDRGVFSGFFAVANELMSAILGGE